MGKPKRSAGTKKPGKRSLWLRILGWLGLAVVAVGVVGVAAVAVVYTTIRIPDPNADFQTNTTFVYYADGSTLMGSFQVQNRTSIGFADMNPLVKDSIVAAENRTFWTDPGFDPAAVARAVVSLVGPEDTVGGSTITQQYIKVMYLTQEKTLSRKAREILLAIKINRERSKEEILESYLNTVYFGRGAYGIEAASRAYFGIPQSELDLAQATALTSIVNSPGNLDPRVSDNAASDLLERYQYSLNSQVEMGVITDSQRREIYDALPEFPEIQKDSVMGGPKGFLLQMVKDELAANGFSEGQINGGGLKIVTTFDADAQDAAVESAQKYALEVGGSKKKAEDIHVGLASIDNETGGVLALYGGPDYTKNYINWATTRRPTGSTFKPYALVAGLRNGWTLQDKVNGRSVTPPDTPDKPVTAGYGRSITLLSATTNSVNPAFVDLVIQLGPDGHDMVVQAAEDAGVPHDPSWDTTGYRIPLGGGEISPLSQAEGYSTFANQGQHVGWHVVSEVRDARDELIYSATLEREQTIEADVATDVTYALTKVAQDGTGRRAAQIGYPVAGKTGSYYNSDLDVTQAIWFSGFTRQITTAVMIVKGDKGTGDLGDVYGSGYPSMIWRDYMVEAMDGKEQLEFAPPTDRTSTQKPEKPTESPTPSPTPTPTPTPTPSETLPVTVPPQSPPVTTPATSAPPSTTPATSAPPSTAPPTTPPPSSEPPTTPATTPPATTTPATSEPAEGGGGSGGGDSGQVGGPVGDPTASTPATSGG